MKALVATPTMTLLRNATIALLGLGWLAIAAPIKAHTFADAHGDAHTDTEAPAETTSDEAPEIEIQTIPVVDGIYMLVGDGGNIGLSVGADGVFAIDSQFAPLTPKIQAAIAELTPEPVRFLVNTHWHFDHVGGNENFANDGAIVIAHDNVRERMATDQFIAAFDRTIPASPAAALPIVTFGDAVTFHFNGETIETFHVEPAHTDGDSVIVFQNANVIHTGDVYFNGLYPFIDLSSQGSIDGIIAAVDRVLELADDETQIIPGHGALSDKAELEAYRLMLVTVRDRMQAAIDMGASLEEILELDLNADYDAVLGNGFLSPEQFSRILHADLTRP